MSTPNFTRTLAYKALAMIFGLVICAAVAAAQEKSQTTVAEGQAEQQVTVQHGEVVYVSGNDLVVKNTDTGELRSFVVPDSARATVDGKEVSVRDLKPGMKLQRTITTTKTPGTVTRARTITGKVWHINAPKSVILQLPDGSNQEYRIPKDQKFTVNGKETDAFALKKGMTVSATVVTTVPYTQIAEQRTVTGQMPAPETPPVVGALLIEETAVEAPREVAAAEPAPAALPQTASPLPLLGLLGLLLSGISLGIGFRRK